MKGELKIRARLFQAKLRMGLQYGLLRTLLARFLAPALVILIIIPFAKIGIDGYVYGNENVVRGDFLYDWKRDIELSELHALKSPVNRANYFLQLSEWRMREADVAFDREMRGEYSFLIPAARADYVVIRLSVDSISEGLIAEGVLFFQKSINETKKIPKRKQTSVFRRMKETMAINAFLLDEIAENFPKENGDDIITPIKNQYLEIARDWEMEAFPERPMHQEPMPHEPSPEEMPPEEMHFVEPEMVDFRFYGDEWREVNEYHEEFDQEFRRFEEEHWDWQEEEIRHFEEEERRIREEEEMKRREEEMLRFEEEFFQEMERLEEDWFDEFAHEEQFMPHPEEPHPEGCPEEFRPVCGELGPRQETFPNECELRKSGAHFLHEGECEFFVDEQEPHEPEEGFFEEEMPSPEEIPSFEDSDVVW